MADQTLTQPARTAVPAAGGQRAVAVWLLTLAAMVAAMVVLGGLTRLTGSGLSMVEWQPFTLLPPTSDAAWAEAFAKYQASPQFRQLNTWMDLAAFKGIFWLEYLHRLWGRLIGVAFVGPFAWFLARGALDRRAGLMLGLLLALGAAQGVVGWLMVASGLVDRPEVAHERLAAHFALGLALYAALLWSGLTLRRPPSPSRRRAGLAVAVLALAATTAVAGALVAGLHAGLIYNTVPWMGGQLVPADYLALGPAWRNVVDNPAAVQFDHRLLAMLTLAAALGLAVRRGGWVLPAMVAVQVGLGVATLLWLVPVPLAAAHQAGALVVVGVAVWRVVEGA